MARDIYWTCPHCKNRNVSPVATVAFHCSGCADLIPTEQVQAQQPPGVTLANP